MTSVQRHRVLDRLWSWMEILARLGAWVGGAMILLAAAIVVIEVIGRKLFVLTISGSDELAGYLFAAGTSLSLAFVLVSRGHVRIDVVYRAFPKSAQALLDILALLGLGVLVLVMTERGFSVFHENLSTWTRSNTDLRTPLAIPQAAWLFGIGLFFLALVLALLRSIAALTRGDIATVQQTIGIPSQQDEISSELESLGIESRKSERS